MRFSIIGIASFFCMLSRTDRREFVFIGMFSLLVVVVLAGGVLWFYNRSVQILTAEVREQLWTYADLAAQQLSAQELARIDGPEDMDLPVFQALVEQIEHIRTSMHAAEYVYVLRATDNLQQLAFVIENDMLLTEEERDLDGDGMIAPDEEVPVPGELYDIEDLPAMREAFNHPLADEEITYDQWGAWMSGYAPIRDEQGQAVAILGIDMRADTFIAHTHSIVSPVLLFIVLMALVLILGSFLLFYLRRRMRLVQRMDAQRRAMVETASHKLGGPIATVRWWVELLGDGSPLKKKEREEAQEQLSAAVDRMSEVTQHLDDALRTDGSELAMWQRLAEETKKEIRTLR